MSASAPPSLSWSRRPLTPEETEVLRLHATSWAELRWGFALSLLGLLIGSVGGSLLGLLLGEPTLRPSVRGPRGAIVANEMGLRLAIVGFVIGLLVGTVVAFRAWRRLLRDGKELREGLAQVWELRNVTRFLLSTDNGLFVAELGVGKLFFAHPPDLPASFPTNVLRIVAGPTTGACLALVCEGEAPAQVRCERLPFLVDGGHRCGLLYGHLAQRSALIAAIAARMPR